MARKAYAQTSGSRFSGDGAMCCCLSRLKPLPRCVVGAVLTAHTTCGRRFSGEAFLRPMHFLIVPTLQRGNAARDVPRHQRAMVGRGRFDASSRARQISIRQPLCWASLRSAPTAAIKRCGWHLSRLKPLSRCVVGTVLAVHTICGRRFSGEAFRRPMHFCIKTRPEPRLPENFQAVQI